jgi:Zn-dependent alcohol dehydrogenase
MQAAVLYAPRPSLVIEDLRLDPPRAGVVRVRVAAICCSWKRHMPQ